MSIFGNLFKNKNEEKEPQPIKENLQVNEPQIDEDEDEIAVVIAAALSAMEDEETVAAITAAIACMLGTSTNDFVVRNIRRTSEIDSLWALKGRMKLMR